MAISRLARRSPTARTRLPASSKSPTAAKADAGCSSRAASRGTPACSCSASAPSSPSAARSRPRAMTPPTPQSKRPSADLDFIRLDEASFAQGARRFRSTMRCSKRASWSASSRSASPGPISAAGTRCGRSRRKDDKKNAVLGDATLSHTSNSLVLTESAHVAVEGLDDVAVIATEDAIFVGKLSDAQKRRRDGQGAEGQTRHPRPSPKSTAPLTGHGAAIPRC